MYACSITPATKELTTGPRTDVIAVCVVHRSRRPVTRCFQMVSQNLDLRRRAIARNLTAVYTTIGCLSNVRTSPRAIAAKFA
jgi:hypothetical protein